MLRTIIIDDTETPRANRRTSWQDRLLSKLGHSFAIVYDGKKYYLTRGNKVLAEFERYNIEKLNPMTNPLVVVESLKVRNELHRLLKPDNLTHWTPRWELWSIQVGLTRDCGFSSRLRWYAKP